MFGLTIEKLFVVAVLAAVVIGPRRLPDYAARLGALVRRMTVLAADARQRVAEETGAADWRTLDPRQYDPRRIIREAWADAAAGEEGSADAVAGSLPGAADAAGAASAADAAGQVSADAVAEEPTLTRPDSERESTADQGAAGHWVVTGSSAHPRRVWVSTAG